EAPLFVESAAATGLVFTHANGASGKYYLPEPMGSGVALFDYDRDGDLDLFVANYVDFSVAGNKSCRDALGARDYCGPREYRPAPDRLYRNEGNGRFTDVTESAGI